MVETFSNRNRRRKRPWAVVCGVLLALPASVSAIKSTDKNKYDSESTEQIRSFTTEQRHTPERPSPIRKQHSPESYARPKFDDNDSKALIDKKSQEFLVWCHQLLGIETLLEIQSFQYPNYMQGHFVNHWARLEEEEGNEVAVEQLDTISVRGLAANRDISIGEVVISIPLHAIISVPTTIDHDPVLSRVLGKKERDRLGWDDSYFELPLLTVAILHHVHNLGPHSPISQYMQVLTSTVTDHMPILWNRTKLQQDTTEGVYKIARSIQKDIVEMYDAVVPVLLREHPRVFEEGALTLREFSWAFTLVNSRHWHLPVPTLLEDKVPNTRDETTIQHMESDLLPPADKPTEKWVSQQGDANGGAVTTTVSSTSPGHSFLAPLADLLNFGPPCTRGRYSADAFELVATCSYQKGQEVTFWYSDDCDDVMIANYGFAHPMVPSCFIRDMKPNRYKDRIRSLEQEVDVAYEDLEKMDFELERVRTLLRQCHCDESNEPVATMGVSRKRAAPTKLRQEDTIRGNNGKEEDGDDGQRHGVRRQWREHKKSDL